MVVLESKGMLTAGSNQYLQPDYLSPLPTTLDAKKSPLALLAQTCSQIGADSSKPLPADKKKDEDKKEKSPPTPLEATRRSPAFKPYESSTKKSMVEEGGGDDKPTGGRKTPASQPSSARPPSSSSGGSSAAAAKEDSGRRSIEASVSSSASTTPIIRSGLEVLAGHPKDVPLGTYRTGMPHLLPPGYPGLESHPALRGAHPGLMPSLGLAGLPSSLASVYPGASAAALYTTTGLPSSAALSPSLLGSSPYLTYTRVKTAGGGEAVVPVCRDPYCTGCPYSVQNNHLLQSGGACPPSCTQCEQAKAALSSLPGLSSLPSSSIVPASSLLPPTSVAAAAAASLYSPSASSLLTGPHRPYVCNWIVGETYCGKRFSTSEELLQHLRTHTSVTAPDSTSLSLLSNPLHAHAALLGSAHSALSRPGMAYPPPALSPLTASRYHPYSKPTSLTTTSALTPTLPGLSPYASALSAYPPGYPSPYAGLYPRPPL
ncbi:zinc finger protein Noc-like [Eriocheir sinensis]|uniref:zinc finger protein Noc-like n=1 Tax=Eriocheir sinensis TaxID=95602 RepID=UPI0021C90FAB|nr:zinc finger protein Noc-like [Eriocheir sinensis]